MERRQGGPLVQGLLERPCGPGGITIQSPLVDHVGPKERVDFRRSIIWKPKEGVGPVVEGPSVETNLHSNVAQTCGPRCSMNPAPDDPLLREEDDMRRLSGAELIQKERSSTDLALAEEAMRYDKVYECLVSGTPSSLSPFFGRTPMGEYCDLSRDGKERDEGENPIQMIMGSKSPTGENADCWDLVEVNNNTTEDGGKEMALDQIVPHASRAEGELSWEKSDLAKFSNFLGFSTEGLEKEIMDFFGQNSWNVRGANDSSKRRIIKAVIRSQRVDLLCLQETKIQSLSEGLVRSLGAGRWSKWVALDAVGSAGGMLVCWDKRSLEVMETEVGKFSVSCDRECLWEELGAIRGLWEDPWCLGGDFNVILSQRERNRQGRLTGAMRIFAQTVDELELMDLPMQGGAFTWSGARDNQSWARLDRFLVTQQWLEMFSGVAQCRLQRPTSDHFPILLMGGGLRRGPTPFRFENMWLKVDGFKGLLREWWQGIEVRGRASFRLASKLKLLKQRIKTWNRELKLSRKKEAKDAFQKWVLLEEVHWRQKSRELWLKEGDRNTGYFHRMANAHRRNNSLDRIMINGEWLTEDQEVREGIVNAFQNFLSEEPGWRADIEGLHLNQITLREAEDLEKPFTEEEIHGALMEMRGDKAPGPDGFTMAFWQECWPFVKEEVVDLFKEFFEYGSFSKYLNTTFLVLIPKKGGAEDLGDFRPISLFGGLYKILAKVLANRLKKVLDRVVSTDQNAFVRGRQILDACSGRWDLGRVGWIGCGGVYPRLNFHLNQRGACWFLSKFKGVEARRSPFLRISSSWAWKFLAHCLDGPGEGGFLSGCRLRGRGGVEMNVSHLLFADDTIIFAKRKESNPKEEGGLGIRKIDVLNKALLGKWVWRYAYEKENLWKRVIGVKYGQEGGGWRTKDARGPESCFGRISGAVMRPFLIIFPQLFTLAGNRNAKVSEVWDSSLGQGGLRLEEDAVRWKRESNGVFGAKGAYKILVGSSACIFPNRRIWMVKVPTKVSFLLGKLRGGRSSLWISFKEGGGNSLTGVFCVDVKRKVRIILCYIVQWLRLYGRSLSPFLESNGCSQNQL
ncbi:Transposon TX1 uncharacterized 149 kDa protein [Vitis vinifera]|uniref:Transposon TX1 uncharacterized 149 kDa protein n=1 Tax=Vitis vinifera TaxID=29760 RepID=A0A438E756_VITVI|nr:Transposon TX1 uncharacterized 149 kDa protein [Vitis vinifera]